MIAANACAADPAAVMLIIHGDIGGKTEAGGAFRLLVLGTGAWAPAADPAAS